MAKRFVMRRGRVRAVLCVGLAVLSPVLAGLSCASGERWDRARADAAPAVSALFGAVGDVVGQFAASLMSLDTPEGDAGDGESAS